MHIRREGFSKDDAFLNGKASSTLYGNFIFSIQNAEHSKFTVNNAIDNSSVGVAVDETEMSYFIGEPKSCTPR